MAIVRSITKTDQLYIHFVDDHRETRAAADMNAKPRDEQYDLIRLIPFVPAGLHVEATEFLIVD